MAAKSDLKHSIIQTLKHNRDGSYKTQANRKERLFLVTDQLAEGGYKIRHIRQLKFKHVKYLVDNWLQKQLNPGTIKNRMTDLRWAMSKFGKKGIIPASNTALNIPKRQYVTNQDKSRKLTEGDLYKIKSSWMQHILKSQALFGLRLEESLKLQPFICDLGHQLYVFKTKNGRERYIPINTAEQREWLEQAKQFVKHREASFIPPEVSYKTYHSRFEKACQRAGIHKLHGHRHLYAHKRFEELTGFPCPAKGGPTAKDLNPEQHALDKKARQIITAELGHGRIFLVSVYCN